MADGDEVTVTVTADNTCQTVNEVTSTGITTTVNAVTAGTIEASVDGGTSYSSSQQVIQAGNDIYWNYTSGSATGTFTNFEYQWGGTTGAYADNWGATTNPWNWGAGQSGVNPNQTIYVRAKASCGSNVAYSDPVAVDWLTCYGGATEIIVRLVGQHQQMLLVMLIIGSTAGMEVLHSMVSGKIIPILRLGVIMLDLKQTIP